MGMSIDEIIAKETEIAQEFQKVVDTHIVNNDGDTIEEMCCDDTEVIEEHLQRCKVLADYHNQIVNTMRKYQQLQADYETRLKADLKAILVELQLEIEEKSIIDYDEDLYDGGECVISISEINEIIQQKINKLKENTDGNK